MKNKIDDLRNHLDEEIEVYSRRVTDAEREARELRRILAGKVDERADLRRRVALGEAVPA